MLISHSKWITLVLGMAFLAALTSNCTSQNMNHAHTNHLINESSPYLLQHAHNPVDWYPWGDEALQKAKDENKLIIISVGYAACHWCHVMEHESFEDSTVAAVMNQHYISIKVDREERPDIDQIYMDAVQLMTGSGGWPMNVVALPDGRPIWGGTYFPKENWMNALEQLADYHIKQPEKAEEYANNLTNGVRALDKIIPDVAGSAFEEEDLQAMITPWKKYFDPKMGGHDRAPKFPMPNNWSFLMQAYHYTGDDSLKQIVDVTLEKMAYGGIYDQIGGGFARYSTDTEWKVPHFEKMLYDNGQLVSLYADAWKISSKPLYKNVIYQTLEWVEREMMSPEGGFYSSLDADSEGEEGKFYVWTSDEIDQILGEDADWYGDYFQISKQGNWEHGNNILINQVSEAEFAAEKGWTTEEMRTKLEQAAKQLMAARDKRVRPGLDDKVLTSWNALMLRGYVDAYLTFGEPAFLQIAKRNASFLLKNMKQPDGGLFRNYKNGKGSINAFLDDYALLADAFLALYAATFDEQWLQEADQLVAYVEQHFLDPESKMYFYTSDTDPALIARKFELTDNVIPAANSVWANVLHDMAILLDKPEYEAISAQMLRNMRKKMISYGSGYSNWGKLMLKHIYPHYEVVVAGPEADKLGKALGKQFLPDALVLAAGQESDTDLDLFENRFVPGETRIYVCQNKACKLPVKTVAEALAQLGRPQ